MLIIKKDLKYLKEKTKSMDFFLRYLNISKMRLIQILNEKNEVLNTLQQIKNENLIFLDSIGKMFFKGKTNFFGSLSSLDNKTKLREKRDKKIYFLIDAKKDDDITKNLYKKFKETISTVIKPTDYVVTFGNKVNLIAQQLELNIIQHYNYKITQNQEKLIEIISNLVESGLRNDAFSGASLMMVQMDINNNELINRQLFPFSKVNESAQIDESIEMSMDTNYIVSESVKELPSEKMYLQFLTNLDLKSLTWLPNIIFFKDKLIKSVLKLNIVELQIVEDIQRIQIELKLLDEKRNKMLDEYEIVKRWMNRLRKEKSTESIILLYAAFKVRNLDNNKNKEYDLIRKKKDEDDSPIPLLSRLNILDRENQKKGGKK